MKTARRVRAFEKMAEEDILIQSYAVTVHAKWTMTWGN